MPIYVWLSQLSDPKKGRKYLTTAWLSSSPFTPMTFVKTWRFKHSTWVSWWTGCTEGILSHSLTGFHIPNILKYHRSWDRQWSHNTESFHGSGRNRLTGVQLMTRIQKRVSLELWWGDWGRTLALSKSSIERDYFRARWSEEDCQLSTWGRVLGVSWKSMQRIVTRRGFPPSWWAVKTAPEVSGGCSQQRSLQIPPLGSLQEACPTCAQTSKFGDEMDLWHWVL